MGFHICIAARERPSFMYFCSCGVLLFPLIFLYFFLPFVRTLVISTFVGSLPWLFHFKLGSTPFLYCLRFLRFNFCNPVSYYARSEEDYLILCALIKLTMSLCNVSINVIIKLGALFVDHPWTTGS